MNKVNAVIVVLLVILCGYGWVTTVSHAGSDKHQANDAVVQADEWASQGLYQRAIGNYEQAFALDPSEEIIQKELSAYNARYAEAPEETLDDFVSFLQKAVSAYPANRALVDRAAEIFTDANDRESLYKCLRLAVANGYDTEENRRRLLELRYAFAFQSNVFFAVLPSPSGVYTVKTNDGWNFYNHDDGFLLEKGYGYLGIYRKEGFAAEEPQNGSRLLDSNQTVLGIFPGSVTQAGYFSDGLLPACIDGKYGYYDEFAQKRLGDYDKASAFQNQKAAVQTGGKWVIIDTAGNPVSEAFEEIVLDDAGCFLRDGKFLAKNSEGVYGLYDEKFRVQATFDCENIGILSESGIIAFEKGGLWGFANEEGNVVIEPQYAGAKSFSHGLAGVSDGEKWGMITADNQLVIPYQFEEVGYMDSSACCPVLTDTAEEEDGDPDENGTIRNWRFLELSMGLPGGE